MELLTKDLIIKPVTEKDIKEIARMWMYPEATTLENAYLALEKMQENHLRNLPKKVYHLCLGVFRKIEPDTIVGWCGLDGNAEPGKTVLFYAIDEKYRNRGYATQCAVELIRYAFERMDYDIIYGGCAKDNKESYRVMQKAGMSQSALYENGDYIFSMDRRMYEGVVQEDLCLSQSGRERQFYE